MPGQPPVRRPERDPLRDQRTRGGHDPVEDHRQLPHRALQQEPGHRRQVRPAHGRQELQLVPEHRPGPAQRVPDRRALAHPGQVVDRDPAPPGHHGRVGAAQRRDQHRRRRGPAHADIAEHHQIGPRVGLLVGDRDPRPQRGLGLLRGERVLDVDTAAAPPHPVPRHVLGEDVRLAVQGHVHDPYGHLQPAREHGHRARALQHRPHQLLRAARGPRRDAQLRDAVVAGEQHHPGPLDRPYRHGAARGGQPFAQLVQAAQRSRRHDLTLPPGLGVTAYAPVRALDQIGEVVQIKAAHSPNSTARERTRPRHIATTPPRRLCTSERDPIRSDLPRNVAQGARPCRPRPSPRRSPLPTTPSRSPAARTAPGAAPRACAPGCARPTRCGTGRAGSSSTPAGTADTPSRTPGSARRGSPSSTATSTRDTWRSSPRSSAPPGPCATGTAPPPGACPRCGNRRAGWTSAPAAADFPRRRRSSSPTPASTGWTPRPGWSRRCWRGAWRRRTAVTSRPPAWRPGCAPATTSSPCSTICSTRPTHAPNCAPR